MTNPPSQPPAPIRDVANAANDQRYELKMSCEERAYPLVVASLRGHHSGIRTLYPPRTVQSVYFDTHDSQALVENLAGISERHKIRVRWYGDATRGVHATLERKNRLNALGTKDTQKLSEPIDVEGTSRYAFTRRVRQLAPPQWRAWLDRDLEPSLWVSYDRDYFATADRTVRITIDRALRFVDLRQQIVLSTKRPTPTPPILVVELKASEANRDRLEELIQELPLRVARCSKFVLGTTPVNGPPPSWFGW